MYRNSLNFIKVKFQLHHTGIKTLEGQEQNLTNKTFQLHHTGIKTSAERINSSLLSYFNCTIQELKRDRIAQLVFASVISIAPYRN